jgi:hypothetical protein
MEAKPPQITKNAVEEAKSKNIDAIVVDTAGRLQVSLLCIPFNFSVQGHNSWDSGMNLILLHLNTHEKCVLFR